MKILYVINSLGPGGAERSLSELVQVLAARGYDVAVVCFHRWPGLVESAVMDAASVTFLSATSWPVRIWKLHRMIKSARPDIVHTTIFESDVAGRLAAWRLPVVVVTSLVNTSYEKERLADPNIRPWKLTATRMLDGLTARHLTHHFHAITRAVADSAVSHLGIDPARVTVVPRGRALERLGEPSASRRAAVRESLGISQDALVLLNVGRQDYQKGHVDLLRAFDRVAAAHPGAVLVQAGRRGHATSAMENLLAASPYADRVHLVGHRDDVPDLLAASDVFVFPSHYEGLGGAVIEAMALALPIVVTRVAALLEVIEDGHNGLSAEIGDPEGLAAAVGVLLSDAQTRLQFAQRSREIFISKYELRRSLDDMIRMYEAISASDTSRR